jgi:dTMP kinase
MSTFAYQARGRGLDLDLVRQLNSVATGGLEPDLTLLLTIDPEIGRSRQRGRPDRIEGEGADFHRIVADAYDEFAAADERTVRIVADAPHDVVHERIWSALSSRWPERFPASPARPGNISAPGEFHECEPPDRGGSSNESTGQETE